jgi:cellulose synthase/poly-beta-1,6-N-acetylglucosamine synthase-like glycosyltransferase
MPGLTLAVAAAGLVALAAATNPSPPLEIGSAGWWIATTALHLPLLVIMCFLVGGLVERFGFYVRGRAPRRPGRLPTAWPTVCVQLPMFNEHHVARRVIEAACAMEWPRERLTVQVLDDSTDADTRALVDAVCADVRSTGVDCRVLRRSGREGYKAGALEAGLRATDAEFLVVFDSDFLPPRDFLVRTVAHFYDADGQRDEGLALVQAQWGHLNHDQSALTRAQSLWVDDHHTLQMSWRSAQWSFVNFTGTAGVWRAAAIAAAGGWRAASLVEDCELSFRVLFAGYRTAFVKEIVAPAELPATYTAYKAQQKRWTQGWAQLQRMHLATLALRYETTPLRRLHLVYHMCIPWQWGLWAVWIILLPFLIHLGLWFGAVGGAAGLAFYLAPPALWVVVAAVIASLETRHTYTEPLTRSTFRVRVGRVVPYLVISTGMLPHLFSAFMEGLFGPLNREFERTPKTAVVTTVEATAAGAAAPPARADRAATPRRYGVKVHWPSVLAEAFFGAYQLVWALVFAANGLWLCALGAAYIASCIAALGYFYGDHDGKRCFVVDRRDRRTAPKHATQSALG